MVIDTHAVHSLNVLYTHKHNSLARYILDAEPYVTPREEPLLGVVAEIAREDEEQSIETVRMIESLGGVPQIVELDEDVASLNYLSLSYLVGVLRERLLQQREQYAAMATDPTMPEQVAELMATVADSHREHVERIDGVLEAMGGGGGTAEDAVDAGGKE